MFGPEYVKIQTVFKRNDRGVIVPGDYSLPEFEYLKDLETGSPLRSRSRTSLTWKGETMSDEPTKQEIDAANKWLEAEMWNASDTRHSIVQIASRMVEALQGDNPTVRRRDSNPSRELSQAPAAIPAVNWQNERILADESGEERDYCIVGNLGEYFSSVFHDERTSEVFNIGFYTAVLAVKLGLVNPDDFEPDIHNSLTKTQDE